MLEFNEVNKFNWTIKYQCLDDKTKNTYYDIAVGKYYDFVPRRHDVIVMENNVYLVNMILYDFDMSTIIVSVQKTGSMPELNQF